jgi:hypothetical protein
MSANLENYTFKDIIENKKIRIPMIQRDYAEGRLNKRVSEIRKNFINELLKPLFSENNNQQLDFIYGYDKLNAFEPLDGQQRLTTLFLLYWIFRDKNGVDILRKNDNPLHSLFTYQTRISSEDFCNTLVQHYACDLVIDWHNKNREIKDKCEKNKNKSEESQKEVESDENVKIPWLDDEDISSQTESYKKLKLSDIIRSKDWFEWEWHKDPSVNSMLIVVDQVMDLLDKNKYEYTTNIYPNLEKITFNLLDLKELKMSDELYVKMNSRGKTLSDFDVIKSTLEEEIQLQGNSLEFENKWRSQIDGKWMNYFWQNYRSKSNDTLIYNDVNNVENKYLMLLQRLIAVNLLFETKDKDEFKDVRAVFAGRDQANDVIPTYLDKSFNKKGKERILNLSSVCNDMNYLIYQKDLSGTPLYEDISELLSKINFGNSLTLLKLFLDDSISYDTLAMFCSMLFFARKFGSKIYSNSQVLDNFIAWMRFTRNTILNDNRYDRIDTIDKLDDTLILFQQLVDEFKESSLENIYLFIRDKLDVNQRKGIENARVEEEKHKATLRLSNSDWGDVLEEAEENDYLSGQICALLYWADDDINSFKTYYRYLSKIISEDSRNNPKFYAAMLTRGDYRNKTNSTLYTFTKQRDRSIKQYLRLKDENFGGQIKELLDEYKEKYPDLTPDEMYSKIIDQSIKNINDWRKYILLCPQMMDYASQKIVVEKDGYYYLRSKIRADVEHHELFLEFIERNISHIDDSDNEAAQVIMKGNTDKEDPNSITILFNDKPMQYHIELAVEGKYKLSLNGEDLLTDSAREIYNELIKKGVVKLLEL